MARKGVAAVGGNNVGGFGRTVRGKFCRWWWRLRVRGKFMRPGQHGARSDGPAPLPFFANSAGGPPHSSTLCPIQMTEQTIYLIGGTDDEAGTLTSLKVGDSCNLSFAYRGVQIDGTGLDFFDAFVEIRRQLEKEALFPFCYGASLNVYPSRMARQMSNGLKAYRLVSGTQAKQDDLVNIFEQGHDVIPASVENQQNFYREWLVSLRA